MLLLLPREDDFSGAERLEELVDIFEAALCDIELAGRDIEEGHAGDVVPEMHGGEEVILAVLEDLIVDGHAGSDHFCHAAFYDAFDHFRVF